MSTVILAIESSCDDTSAAILKDGKILANVIANQNIHEAYGGVVPELASRAHQQNIIPVVAETLKRAGLKKEDIHAVAFTRGPGLIGSLLVGVSFAKAFALAMDIPLIEVNHMQAHVLAHFIDDPKPVFPFLCLTVSGGHTQIVLVKDHLSMEVVGETLDDAAGEAFDKTSKLLGLPYPGGPLMDKLAKKGNPRKYIFAEPQVPDLNFSFSGLKTSVLYFLQEQTKENPDFIKENLEDLCASIQERIVSILMNKLIKAAKQYQINYIGIGGGVAANSQLRDTLKQTGEKLNWQTFIPKFEYCTDNAAMIAITGYYKYQAKEFIDQLITPVARYSI